MGEIKVGDIVRVSEVTPSIYTKGIFQTLIPRDMMVMEVEDDCARIGTMGQKDGLLVFEYIVPTKYLVKVNAEPNGPVEKSFDGIFRDMADNFDWQQYAADVAEKIAVAYAEQGRYEPAEIGKSAVLVAKSVVEGLKS